MGLSFAREMQGNMQEQYFLLCRYDQIYIRKTILIKSNFKISIYILRGYGEREPVNSGFMQFENLLSGAYKTLESICKDNVLWRLVQAGPFSCRGGGK